MPSIQQRRVRPAIMKNKDNLMPIGTTAKAAGISTQSLQYYIMVGLITPAAISKTNRRLFNEKTIERIKLIRQLNDSGYSLRDIRELFLAKKK
jgi:DNA-binding transcriptional MerR regulator